MMLATSIPHSPRVPFHPLPALTRLAAVPSRSQASESNTRRGHVALFTSCNTSTGDTRTRDILCTLCTSFTNTTRPSSPPMPARRHRRHAASLSHMRPAPPPPPPSLAKSITSHPLARAPLPPPHNP
ncbi:hypothetical protein E2C01_069593 [Portunus trituberculatus]|uniref:Uncharacterized protein n=1 Tax=Portunus trituberculatus TaxID=210409 RepID=A0A5B7HZZ4_PORTR|nr:hypothetical protein [Portunus trituberculatus]